MMDSHKRWLPWLMLLGCPLAGIGIGIRAGAGADATPQDPNVAQVLAKLLPLPDDVPRSIMNPYHAHSDWKLWALDPTPVTIDKPQFKGTFAPPAAWLRKYPVLALRRGSTELALEPLGQKPLAGFWDDCYMSLDDDHTHLGYPKNQFIDGGKMRSAQDVETLLQLGVNFTSQSYADRGRAIVDDLYNNLNTERHFFFANGVRATPAHDSYRDENEDQVTDLYDGLFAHSYQSVGQSGSEMHALYKMMVAGACMPRSTKNLLKKHGAYAIALLTLFKAALPYADAQGQPLPYEHELRHRPAYSSNGTPAHPHFCPANVHYHGYDERAHLQAMMELARNLTSAPPVAIARLLGFTITKAGVPISDHARLAQRIKCLALTNMRFWGQPNEVLEVRISLNQSYDLQQRMLHFKCLPLYPNQKNVSIKEELPGIFNIRVQHDPNLPKGRIPIICTANNGQAVPSNPVFINFYWPEANEIDDYFSMRGLPDNVRQRIEALGLKRFPVTVNRRPLVDYGITGDALRCQPGQTVSIDLKAHDPEGYPVTVFRRTGQIGTIEQGRFTAHIPATDRNEIYHVHFIFSDGTGGCTGKQIKLLVATQESTLPEGWAVTTLGPVQQAVNVNYDGNSFTFGQQLIDRQIKPMQGTFVFQSISGATDLKCQIPTGVVGTDMALMITNTLDDFARKAAIGVLGEKVSGIIKSTERSPTGDPYPWSEEGSPKPEYFRLTWRDELIAGYISTDNQTWEQIMVGKAAFFRSYYAGLIYRGDPWTTGVCQWLPSSGPALPVLQTDGKNRDEQGQYEGPLTISITSPDPNLALHYTQDGSEPTAHSPIYKEPLKLTQAGRHEIRIKAFQSDLAQDTVVAVYHLKP